MLDSNALRKIACVTGASGMLGSRIVYKLLALGIHVRVLTRHPYNVNDSNIEVFYGGLSDVYLLDEFIKGADFVFHCAAELRDESKMYEVNVVGTKLVVECVARHKVKYFCYISSAGVVGQTSEKWVDESTLCNPQNIYEKTKCEAEKFALMPISGCSTVVLRPTNVISKSRAGALRFITTHSLKNWLDVFVKGGECAHIVHVDDVVRAAVFFIKRSLPVPKVFFVSIDSDPLNTVAHIYSLYRTDGISGVKFALHLPMLIPFLIRRLSGKPSNYGDIRYSSVKLSAEGFVYEFDVTKAVRDVFQENIPTAQIA